MSCAHSWIILESSGFSQACRPRPMPEKSADKHRLLTTQFQSINPPPFPQPHAHPHTETYNHLHNSFHSRHRTTRRLKMALCVTYTYLRDFQPRPYHSVQSSETPVYSALKYPDKSTGFISLLSLSLSFSLCILARSTFAN